jgi:hypothetical protein
LFKILLIGIDLDVILHAYSIKDVSYKLRAT